MSAIDSTLPAGSSSSAPNGFSALSSEEFMKIIFTELQNQDPMKPNDSSALLDQMSSLRSIQSDMDLSRQLQTLVTQNQLASAGNLIGEFVTGLTFGNQRASGWVVSISRTADGPILNLDNGYRLPFDNVDEIVDGDLIAPVDDGGDDDDTDGPDGPDGPHGPNGGVPDVPQPDDAGGDPVDSDDEGGEPVQEDE